ncbi:MAG: hypothetical protein IPL60_12200 [Ardenticatenia bacterium]|nr:hypothetical protein [Ardenticatenia bacterium]
MAVQALVLGFGGTGTHILTHLKVLAVQKYGTAPDFIKFLEFDTIADWEPGKTVQIAGIGAEDIPKGEEDDMSLVRSSEYMYLSDREPSLWKYVSEILKPTGQPDRYPHLTNWLHVDWLGRHVKQAAMDITQGAAQQRQIGRFAMFQNRADIVQRIGGHIRQLSDRAAGTQVFVWIVGSTVGGTGAGCMIDAAYMSRLAAHAVGVEDINVTGVFVLPAVYRNVGGISDARAYSLLRELNRVQSTRDNYVLGAETVCSAVMYDAHSTVRGVAKSKLFDSVFYLGATCAELGGTQELLHEGRERDRSILG